MSRLCLSVVLSRSVRQCAQLRRVTVYVSHSPAFMSRHSYVSPCLCLALPLSRHAYVSPEEGTPPLGSPTTSVAPLPLCRTITERAPVRATKACYSTRLDNVLYMVGFWSNLSHIVLHDTVPEEGPYCVLSPIAALCGTTSSSPRSWTGAR
jgi:hypothetical protein